MKRLEEILEFNKAFVENGSYKKFQSTKFPDKKMVILSCMDTRLTQLLPEAMNLKNGDAKFIKNAGAVVSHPFGSIMRSIIVAVYELNAEEVFVIGHHGCGMSTINYESILSKMKARGVSDDVLATLNNSGIDLPKWLHGFECVNDSVRESVEKIKSHPLLPKDVIVHGLIMDPETGKLDLAVSGY